MPGRVRYDGRDLDLSRPIIDSKALIQDYLTGVYYPQEEMVRASDGNWYHRDNVDEDLNE